MIKISKLGKWALGLGLAAALAGCASVSVKQGTDMAVPQMPQQIFVAGFDTTVGVWNVDPSNGDLGEFQQNLQNMLAAGIASDISDKLNVPTSQTSNPGMLSSQNAWLVTGEFIRVNQGSRALRAVVGFGAGGTKLETVVKIYDLQNGYSQRLFLTFTTEGGSGAMPGAIASGGPLGAAVKGAAGAAKGLTQDTSRTARMITAEISQYMYQNQFIPKSMVLQVKTN